MKVIKFDSYIREHQWWEEDNIVPKYKPGEIVSIKQYRVIDYKVDMYTKEISYTLQNVDKITDIIKDVPESSINQL